MPSAVVEAAGCRRALSPLTSATTSADRSVIRTDMRPEDLVPPPDLTGKSIRFSDDFHPLDHRFGDSRCRQLQRRLRGPYRHAKLQWQYGPAGDRVRTPLHRYTTCVIATTQISLPTSGSTERAMLAADLLPACTSRFRCGTERVDLVTVL